MKTPRADLEPYPIVCSNHFRLLDIGELIDARVGLVKSVADLNASLAELRKLDLPSGQSL